MNDFDIMSKMSHDDADIKMSPHLVSANKVKAGGHVTIGVDDKTFNDIAFNGDKYYVVLYVINKEQFNEIKNNSTATK